MAFPRTLGIIHHGGAGTVAAAIRAGKPQVIIAQTADQPFWATRIESLGLGKAVKNLGKFSKSMLEESVTLFKNPSIKDKAENLGKTVREEGGVSKAVAEIERAYESSKERD